MCLKRYLEEKREIVKENKKCKSWHSSVPDTTLVRPLNFEGKERLEPLLREGVQHLHLTTLECPEIKPS
jgi:hypothetical protein